MKTTGITVVVLLCVVIASCGCVQIIINPPGMPGTSPPVSDPGVPVTRSVTLPGDDPMPVSSKTPVTAAPAPSRSTDFIVPIGDLDRIGHRTFTFNYASEYGGPYEYTVRIPVNMSVYYGAKQMKIDVPSSSMDPKEIRAYIDTFESDPAMEELYTSVLTQLRNARYQNGQFLSDDEYFEMIVAFVQQIPPTENPSPKRRYPVEVIYEKTGDSDEKSLLLVNLLAREGYDVALLVYEDLQYETTGVRVIKEVPDASLLVFTNGKKDYVFIDAYRSTFIGNVPDEFQGADDPGIYPVGHGTKSYGPINYVWKVVADLKRLKTLKLLDSTAYVHSWDKTGTCSWIKNKKLLMNTTCYCCDM